MQLVLLVLTRGDEQDKRVSLLSRRAAQRETVCARQHDVEQKQIEGLRLDQVKRRIAVRCGNHSQLAAALRREIIAQHLAHIPFVLRQ